MEELLKKLLDAQILSEETKGELECAIRAQLDEAIEATKAEVAADTSATLTERWLAERDALIEALDKKIEESLVDEISELREDIERFRDLESEYSEKLVEAKKAMQVELKNDLKDLVEKLDTFLEIRLSEEIAELKEDIDTVRENDFGRRIFETFKSEFVTNYADPNAAGLTLKETETRLSDTAEALEEAEKRVAELERHIKMDQVLKPLNGSQREVMEAILKTVKTDKLDEAYKTFIGRVLRETEKPTSEKESKVLAESANKGSVKKTVVKTGDNSDLLESELKQASKPSEIDHLRRLAGL